ncbi:MAG: type II secretion system protein [Sporolactobacillus sp.]|uniref:type IV pilus modification PilV family protein n=1 Tax=Sporolactobacillus sp. STSJ-5 TaxID=2965076 RepID=UPI00210752CC|nr:type II secretion system protein [Sporolactobacillus sp. STSJ-5]MCQ2008505.1 type II secretion system GspH family protein [Sporolactobacillus sp. STSJ-5]
MNRKQDGMTLIEVIAAITLLSIVILSFAYVFIQSQQVTTGNGSKLTALQLAQKKLSDILDGSSLPADPGSSQSSPTAVPSNTKYTIHSSSSTVGNATYETYVYVLNKDSDENQPIVVRTYYNNTNYVELYNYYTTSGN